VNYGTEIHRNWVVGVQRSNDARGGVNNGSSRADQIPVEGSNSRLCGPDS